jgi:hypothetical protein
MECVLWDLLVEKGTSTKVPPARSEDPSITIVLQVKLAHEYAEHQVEILTWANYLTA